MSNTANTKLSVDDINRIFGRELVPGQLANTFLRAANLFSQGGSDKKSFSKIRFNTDNSMTRIQLDEGYRPTHQDATCYYMLKHTHCQKGTTGGKMHFTPWLEISVGAVNGGDLWGSESMVNIMLDIRKPGDVEIDYALASNLGLEAPQQHDQKLAIMRIAGSWMERIDNGETLDPIECRKQIKKATGLGDGRGDLCKQTMLDRMLARLSAPYAEKALEERSLKASARVQRLYTMGRNRHRSGP